MVLETCVFSTGRLSVAGWHEGGAVPAPPRSELPGLVAAMLSADVTKALPPAWQGVYTLARAETWIEERDAEGPTLLVQQLAGGAAVGLMVLHEMQIPEDPRVDVRLGYLLAESAWGKGIGSELVAGFVGWCRARAEIRSITGGVAQDNIASARILEKNGFTPVVEAGAAVEEETIYGLVLHP